MKTMTASAIALALFMATLAQPALAQQPSAITSTTANAAYKLTIVVSNVNNRSGKLYVGLANNKASFDGESVQRKAIDVPPSGEMTITFESVAPGRYAVRLFQDLNNNEKMDFSGQRPTEPFGFSNVTMLMGPPDFDESSFDLTEDKSIRIRVMEL